MEVVATDSPDIAAGVGQPSNLTDIREKLRVIVRALARSAAVEEHRQLPTAEGRHD
jgi:hypothetical protein